MAAGAETITWTNGGGNNLWTNPANWDLNRLPQPGDDVVFDATSTDNVQMFSVTADISSLTVEPGYTGTLGFAGNTIRIRELFHLNGGAYSGGNSTYTCDRDFLVTGGTQSGSGDRFNFQGVENCTVDFGASDWLTSTVNFQPDEDVTIDVDGTFRLSSFDMTAEPGSMVRLAGTATAVEQSFNQSISSGTLVIADGGVLDLRKSSTWDLYGTALAIQQGTGRIRRDARGVAFTDDVGGVIPPAGPFDTLYLELFDDDANTDGSQLDTLTVVVTSEVTGDSETIILTEGFPPGQFRTISPLTVAAGAASPEDGTVQRNGDEDLIVTYADPEDPDDTLTARLMRPLLVWDGGGADNDWDTAENWNPDTPPTQYDDVLFDGTSSKDCTIFRRATFFRDMTIDAAYGGTVALGGLQFNERHEFRNFTQHGGTATTGTFATLLLEGSFVRTGGTTGFTTAFVGVTGPGTTEFDAGPDPITVRQLQTGTSSAVETHVRGTVNSTLTFSALGNGTTRIHDSVTMLPGSSGVQSSTNGTLVIEDGAVLDAREINNLNLGGTLVQQGTGVLRRNAKSIQFTDAAGVPVGAVAQGAGVYVTLEDEDENETTSPDTVTVVVTSETTGDSETITLTETGPKTETFRNAAALPTAGGAAVAEDGVLQYDGAEDLFVHYTDDEDADDTIMTNLLTEPVVWDGGGADNLWTTPENWSGDALPIATDRVFFDGTSSKDCDLGFVVEVGSLTIAEEYTGTIGVASGTLITTRVSFVQDGGTIAGPGTPGFVAGGDFILSGGTFDVTSGRLELRASGPALIDFGPEARTFFQISATDGTNGVTTIRGDVLVQGVSQFFAVGGTYTFEGDFVVGILTADFSTSGSTTFVVADGGLLDLRSAPIVRLSGTLTEQGSGLVRRNASGLAVVDAEGDPVDAMHNTDLYLTITDEDENTDGSQMNVVSVVVENDDNGDVETFELTETSNFRGVFMSATPFRIQHGTVVSENGIVEAGARGTLTIRYEDDEDLLDTLEIQAPIVPEGMMGWAVE